MTAGRGRRLALAGALVLAAAAAGAGLAGPAMGLFSGSRPTTLGFAGGRFADGDWRPNWVSSTAPADDARHRVAPLAFRGDAARAWACLAEAISATQRATVVSRSAAYLHAEFASRGLGFVDDGEFALDAAAGVIHVKSAARLGVRDFGVNRARIEALRAALAACAGQASG